VRARYLAAIRSDWLSGSPIAGYEAICLCSGTRFSLYTGSYSG
jgi:hypothetical protein